jgi:membrane protease YdiL (CAAX protease family)
VSSADRPISQNSSNPGTAPSAEPIRFFPPFPSWTGFDVIGIAVIFLIAMIVCWVVACVIASMLPPWQHARFGEIAKSPLVGIAAQTAAYVVMFFYIARILRQRSGESAMVAIEWNSRLGTVVMGIVGGLVLATIVQLAELILPVPKTLPIDALFQNPLLAYVTSIFGVLIAPMFEELYFRGLMFPSLREGLGELAAIFITAAAFALLHGAQLAFAWAALLPLFVVGLVLTWFRAQLKSVAASWTMHVTYNATIVVAVWVSTGHFHNFSR